MESDSQTPYKIQEEEDLTYSFTTKHGITYHAYFLDYSNYHPAFSNVYTFNIEPENETTHPIDRRIALTVTEDYTLYVSLYLHKSNVNVRQLVNAFYEVVKNNLYPLQ